MAHAKPLRLAPQDVDLVRRAVAADDQHVEVLVFVQLRRRPDQDIDPLQRLDSADEQDDPLAILQPELAPRDLFLDRREQVEIDAAWHDGDRRSIGAVEFRQQMLLVLTRDDDAIRARGDRAFGIDPRSRLVLGRAGAILYLAERVEHRDVRHVPTRAQADCHHAGHPVVAVHHVVGDALARREREYVRLELVEVRCDHFFADRRARTRGDVDDARVRAERLGQRRIGRRGAGEDIDAVATRAERLAELADVDVHAAGLAAAHRRQRRRVDAQHGDAPAS